MDPYPIGAQDRCDLVGETAFDVRLVGRPAGGAAEQRECLSYLAPVEEAFAASHRVPDA